jgi:hypothetical protein
VHKLEWDLRKLAALIGVSVACLGNMSHADAACIGRPADEKIVIALSEVLAATGPKAHSAKIKAIFGGDCSSLTILFDESGLRPTFFERAALIHADDGRWYVLYPANDFRGDAVEVK